MCGASRRRISFADFGQDFHAHCTCYSFTRSTEHKPILHSKKGLMRPRYSHSAMANSHDTNRPLPRPHPLGMARSEITGAIKRIILAAAADNGQLKHSCTRSTFPATISFTGSKGRWHPSSAQRSFNFSRTKLTSALLRPYHPTRRLHSTLTDLTSDLIPTR
jgi:hypothetical protein